MSEGRLLSGEASASKENSDKTVGVDPRPRSWIRELEHDTAADMVKCLRSRVRVDQAGGKNADATSSRVMVRGLGIGRQRITAASSSSSSRFSRRSH